MKIDSAERMNAFTQSVFAELTQLKKRKLSLGHHVIDLSIGSPDLPPPVFVREKLAEMVTHKDAYAYSLVGTADFHQAVSAYYRRSFSVSINPTDEVLLLMGSQDGLVHLPLVLCNPGDYILMPDPGYTAYFAGAKLASAEIYPMPLLAENQFLPDLEAIPLDVLVITKLMILNFPGNPVPAMATPEFFKKVVEFAKKHHIVVLHDFAYSELYFDEKPISFLSIPGAKDVGIEMNSLSKSFSMAGCRIAYALGNPELISMLNQLKTNLDYGVFLPIQAAASLALTDSSDYLEENRMIYKRRRDLLISGLAELGWQIDSPKASMFIWAKVPEGFTSTEFTVQLLEKANVVVTPGNAFGRWGEGYVRIALVQPESEIIAALQNIKACGILNHYKIQP
ncbi:LL-diaminopimelate aminotransferase [Bacillus sp. DNRA2]|uniref:LL-diaminopimelate aminotransferase n=1 Tax=Bacillus sp. DNRA2 TaxID=2723053 RepID=UPI00145DC3F1|nr:LL-diaminopimelate aminotransferase [Bacillus sp. DNRA2]NMD72816.1 LL-diaminopimelate aminotransferase [Bacillus sp. DNRA2]